MNKTTKINILAYASQPDKDINYDGDIVEYEGKRYFVSLAEERVEFIGNLKVKWWLNCILMVKNRNLVINVLRRKGNNYGGREEMW